MSMSHSQSKIDLKVKPILRKGITEPKITDYLTHSSQAQPTK